MKKGTKIFCKNQHLIATTKKDFKEGQLMKVENFDFDSSQPEYKNGQTIQNCLICDKDWVRKNSEGRAFFPFRSDKTIDSDKALRNDNLQSGLLAN